MSIQQKTENLFSIIFSEKVIKKFEKYILFLASIGFVIHLIIILLNNYNIIELSIAGTNLFSNPISALYTPFSFILIYEAFLLIYYIPRRLLQPRSFSLDFRRICRVFTTRERPVFKSQNCKKQM